MFFLDRNRERVNSLAQQLLNQVNETGESANILLEKMAREYQLNEHWLQRIVEEYNILSFLQKLKEGTQHENFPLLEPVIDEAQAIVGVPFGTPMPLNEESKKMEKAASYGYQNYQVTADMFNYGEEVGAPFESLYVDGDYVDDSDELEKVAFEKENLRQQIEDDMLVKEAAYKVENERYKIVGELTKIANISPGVAKLVVYKLVKEANDEQSAEDVLISCKHNTFEVMNAHINEDIAPYEMEKIAGITGLIEELKMLLPAKKVLSEGGKKAVDLAKYFKKNPEKAIIALMAAKQPYEHLTTDSVDAVKADIAAFANS